MKSQFKVIYCLFIIFLSVSCTRSSIDNIDVSVLGGVADGVKFGMQSVRIGVSMLIFRTQINFEIC